MNFGHLEFFSETFEAFLNREAPFSAKIDDPTTLQYIPDIAHLNQFMSVY